MAEILPLQTPDRSFVDYLEEAGEDGDDLGRLDASGDSAGELVATTAMTMTPTAHSSIPGGLISPQLTEARSFVNGLLSPFSPLLKEKGRRGEYMQYVSLQPCRKVSVVVRILPCGESEQEQRCVFPHIKGDTIPLIQQPKMPRDMVVVNPSAFGTHLPSSVTLETARLVAQVAHISSEDWARLYEFHHVMWPSPERSNNQEGPDQFRTMDSLSRAVVQDAIVELQSSLVISLGQEASCIGGDDSLWTQIISHTTSLMEEKTVCTMSLVEILEDKDTFRDLLDSKNNGIVLRHMDMNGAVLHGLTEVPIDSMPGFLKSLSKRKRSNSTIIGTLSIWDNAVSHELGKSPGAQITCVEMAPGANSNQRQPEDPGIHRKGTVTLGRALRQLLLHASVGTEPVISYRETTVTKVLQRALENSKIVLLASVSQLSKDYESTLATLNYLRRLLVKPGKMATSPFRKDAEVVDRCQSPPRQQHDSDVTSIPSPSRLQDAHHDPYLLEKIVADPRQRLAKIFKPSPVPRDSPAPLEYALSEEEEDYQPVDYMDYENHVDLQFPKLFAETNNSKPDLSAEDETKQNEEVNRRLLYTEEPSDESYPGKHSYEEPEYGDNLHSLDPQDANGSVESHQGHNEDDESPLKKYVEGLESNDKEKEQKNPDLFDWNSDPIEDSQLDLKPQIDSDHKEGHREDQIVSTNSQLYDIGKPERAEEEEILHDLASSSASSMSDHYDSPEAFHHGKEIQTLEGAVNQIQSMHTGLWKASSLSLGRLKDSIQFQQNSLKNLEEEKEDLTSKIAFMEDDMRKVSEEYEGHLVQYEEELQQLHNQLEQARNDKDDVEKIAEDAISSQAHLEEQLKVTGDDLSRAKEISESSQKEMEALVESQEALKEEILGLKEELNQSELDKRESEILLSTLKETIETLEGDRNKLQQEGSDDQTVIEELRHQLKLNEESLCTLEKYRDQVESQRLEEKSHLEGLKNESRRYGESLANMEKEKLQLEDLRQEDNLTIQKLREQLQENKSICQDLEAELTRRDGEVFELKANVKTLEQEKESIENSRKLESAEGKKMKADLTQLKLSYNEIVSELDSNNQGQQERQGIINKLKNELEVEREARADAERIQQEATRLKQEASEMKYHISNLQTQFDLRESEIEGYKKQVHDLRGKLSVSQERETSLSTDTDKEIHHLKGCLDGYKAELELQSQEKANIALKLDAALERESKFSRQLEERNKAIEKYKLSAVQTKEELSRVEGRTSSLLAESNQKVLSYTAQIAELKEKLSLTMRERDDYQSKISTEDPALLKSLSDELNQAKEQLKQKGQVIQQMSLESEREKYEKQTLEEKVLRMKADLHNFQATTREKVDKVINYHRGSTQEFEALRNQNEQLKLQIQNLQEVTGKLQEERDACFQSLETGRHRLASIASKAGRRVDDMFSTLRPPRNEKHDYKSSDMQSQPMQELYLTNYSVDQMLSSRAEEIAACLALSAKHSIQESQDEASHLRSKVVLLEEEKEAEVASLRAKIRLLENELVNVETKESSYYSHRRRYVIDPSD